MAYALGKIEETLKAIKDRIESYTAEDETLEDIKGVYIGSRPLSDGTNLFPIIYINLVSYSEDSVTQAYSGGEKTAILSVEIKILAEKIQEAGKYSQNVLYDSTGKGVIAYFQWLLDALNFQTDDTWNATLGLTLDAIPDATFSWQEKADFVELISSFDFKIRYTYGTMGGVIS
ncbi:MAG: hypothetical protein GY756_10005 [bacterium]|nr:hypothetical protein [bacterium]